MSLERVISGGQTGADRAGLAAARAAGIPTGGWMPRGFVAHDGPRPEFAALYGVRETDRPDYPSRTRRNVRESDATLRLATAWDSPGELLTLELCRRYRRPHLDVTPGAGRTPADAAGWVAATGARVLNVAGNSERASPGIEAAATEFLAEVFRQLLLAGLARAG